MSYIQENSQLNPVNTTPTRTLNTNFQPSATQASWVTYSVNIVSSATLVSGQTGTVTLYCDSSSTPSTIRAQHTGSSSVSLAIAVTVTDTTTAVLSCFVPAGHYVKIGTSGTSTMNLVAQTETTF